MHTHTLTHNLAHPPRARINTDTCAQKTLCRHACTHDCTNTNSHINSPPVHLFVSLSLCLCDVIKYLSLCLSISQTTLYYGMEVAGALKIICLNTMYQGNKYCRNVCPIGIAEFYCLKKNSLSNQRTKKSNLKVSSIVYPNA